MSSSNLPQQEIKKAEEALDRAQGGTVGRAGSTVLELIIGIVKWGLYFLLLLIFLAVIRMLF